MDRLEAKVSGVTFFVDEDGDIGRICEDGAESPGSIMWAEPGVTDEQFEAVVELRRRWMAEQRGDGEKCGNDACTEKSSVSTLEVDIGERYRLRLESSGVMSGRLEPTGCVVPSEPEKAEDDTSNPIAFTVADVGDGDGRQFRVGEHGEVDTRFGNGDWRPVVRNGLSEGRWSAEIMHEATRLHLDWKARPRLPDGWSTTTAWIVSPSELVSVGQIDPVAVTIEDGAPDSEIAQIKQVQAYVRSLRKDGGQ